MDMNSLCAACARGPSGNEGHAALHVEAIGNDMLTFRCGSCGAQWSRTAKRGGQFVFDRLAARTAGSPWMGVLLPRSANIVRGAEGVQGQRDKTGDTIGVVPSR